ncbi:hypothetical protein [Mesorhizobium sp.]|uniref:hypothetical protein n=1 Tax=Mesorhizobium sp. TaxID=1871066 RepID=UPI0025E5FD2B|nr:hypothetical protein [Mesorhizobium sp.]
MYFGLNVDMATILLVFSAQRACTTISIVGDLEDKRPHSRRPEADRFVLHRRFGRELRQVSFRALGAARPVGHASAEDAARAAKDSENASRMAAGREELLSLVVYR